MSEEKYYYAGRWCGEPIYLEEGMKMDLGTKIPLFLMKILPKKLGFAKGEVNEKCYGDLTKFYGTGKTDKKVLARLKKKLKKMERF